MELVGFVFLKMKYLREFLDWAFEGYTFWVLVIIFLTIGWLATRFK